MSLQTERILLEAKIGRLERDMAQLAIEADMHILNLRMSASPALDIEELDMDKIRTATGLLDRCVTRTKELSAEVKRLKKAL